MITVAVMAAAKLTKPTSRMGSSDAPSDNSLSLKIIAGILIIFALTAGAILVLNKLGVFKK